jgi:formylglycine-generating enzyme required for sulfatase activity
VVDELLLAMHWTVSIVEAPDSLVITSPIVMGFVRVPAAELLMGSDPAKDPEASPNEQPQHRLILPEFHIGRHPITNAQYAVFVQATDHSVPDQWQNGAVPSGEEHYPVRGVSWSDAVAFCDWLRKASGSPVRLPTEAEWEKAARGTTGQIYPWGDQSPNKELCNCNMWVGDTTPVGRYPQGASPYGALDMSGNVWEWCLTKWRDNYWTPPDDGLEENVRRVLRGGSYYFNPGSVRCAVRYGDYPDLWSVNLGFRVVVAPIRL